MVSLEICHTTRRGICFFESLSCSVLTEHAFLAHYFAVMLFQHLQFCCQRLWKSLALFSLFHSTGPEWLFKVWDGRLGGRRKVLSLEARCTFWAVREHMWLSLSWLLVLVRLMNKIEAFAFFFLAYFSTELIRLCLLWSSAFKEGLILSGGNKKAKDSLRTLKCYLFFSAESNILHFTSDILVHNLLYEYHMFSSISEPALVCLHGGTQKSVCQ